MSPQAQTLGHYRELALAYDRMLESALNGDWDEVAVLERGCRERVEALRALGDVKLDADGARQQFGLIRHLLDCEASIRALAGPWMGKLEELIAEKGNSRRLRASYGEAA